MHVSDMGVITVLCLNSYVEWPVVHTGTVLHEITKRLLHKVDSWTACPGLCFLTSYTFVQKVVLFICIGENAVYSKHVRFCSQWVATSRTIRLTHFILTTPTGVVYPTIMDMLNLSERKGLINNSCPLGDDGCVLSKCVYT